MEQKLWLFYNGSIANETTEYWPSRQPAVLDLCEEMFWNKFISSWNRQQLAAEQSLRGHAVRKAILSFHHNTIHALTPILPILRVGH